MDNLTLLDLGVSQAVLRALQLEDSATEEVGDEQVLGNDLFSINNLISEDPAAARRYKHHLNEAKEFTKPHRTREKYPTSPANSVEDRVSRY